MAANGVKGFAKLLPYLGWITAACSIVYGAGVMSAKSGLQDERLTELGRDIVQIKSALGNVTSGQANFSDSWKEVNERAERLNALIENARTDISEIKSVIRVSNRGVESSEALLKDATRQLGSVRRDQSKMMAMIISITRELDQRAMQDARRKLGGQTNGANGAMLHPGLRFEVRS